MNAAWSYAELGIPLFPGIPLTVLDDVPVATVEPLPIPPTLPLDPPECVAKYAQYLKEKYKRMPTLPEGEWPPSLGRQYTRLVMIQQKRELPGAELVATMEKDYIHGNIDNIVKKKKEIELPEIFLPTEDGGQQLKILMDGAPGVGKSTLSRKVCKEWASGELLQHYHLVLLLALRQPSIREATSIEDLIEADDPDLKQQVVQHIQRTSGEHILLIVDGYDELSYEHRTQHSLFLGILKGNKFLKSSVLVTSRPYASDYLQQLQSINRHIEVLGFTEKQIEHCILENIPDKAKATELVQSLKERQDIASLCYIPLNCAIVLYVYKEQCTLPHSLTKLYEIFILNAVKRHTNITGNDPRIIRRFKTLAALPEALKKQLSALSKLAYDGLVADKMAFSTDDLEAAFSDCSDFDVESNLLGLMTVFKGFISTGEELSYQFLHLTIQEFLAARWAESQLSPDELLKFFQDHLTEERYRMMLLFLAGISQLKFPCAETIFGCNKLSLRYSHTNQKIINLFFFLAHLIYESRNFILFHSLSSAIEEAKLSARSYSISLFDCLVLAHFLAWCDCSLKLLNLSYCGLTSQSLEIIHRVTLEHRGSTQIEEVNLSYNRPELMTKLSLLPKLKMFEYTKKLRVHSLQVPGVSVNLLCVLNMKHLTTLEISVKGVSSVIYLSLDKFQCQHGNIDCQIAVDIFRSLELNTRLEELDLSENSQLAEGDSEAVGCAMERMLKVNKTLKVLNLSGCNITDPIVKHILTGLTKNTSLVTLDMGSPKLSGSCAVSLFQQMTIHPNLSITVGEVNVLGVGRVMMDRGSLRCVIGDLIPESCVEFFRALNNSGLKISKLNVVYLTDQALKLYHCNISSTGAVSIFTSLEHNTSLEELDLSGNSQLAEGNSEAVGCAIERMLNVNRTLKVLNLSSCNITDTIVKHIVTGLTKNTSLVTLQMRPPKLSVRRAVSLFQHIVTHPTLSITVGVVDVLGVGRVKIYRGSLWCVMGDMIPENCVGFFRDLNNSGLKVPHWNVQNLTDQTAEHFAVGLAESQSIQALKLEHCNISSTGAVSIFRSLEHNTTLKELDLSENSQLAEGDSEAVGCAIERMLNVNRTLKVLNLNGCNVTDPIAKRILTGLIKNTSPTTLHMGSCKLSVGCVVSLLQQVTTHPTLQLVGWLNVLKIGNVEIKKGNVLCVESRIIHEHCMEKYVEFFRALNDSDVRVSKLKVKDLTDRTAEHLAIVLAEYKSVQALDLKHNKICSAGAVSIFRSLEHNNSLEELDLSGNSQLVEDDSEAVGCAIERMVSVNRTLKVLNLSGCSITDTIVKHILTGLTKNTSLTTVNIGSSTLSVSCAVSLLQQMKISSTLSRVHVGEMNVLGVGKVTPDRRTATVSLLYNLGDMIPENCVDFIRAINHSGMVSRLKIVQPFTYKSAEYIAGLTRSLSVQALDFKHCNISSGNAVSIFRSLEHNTSLEELDLSGNWRLAEGDIEAVGCAIERMLNVNRTLKVLNIHNCGLGTPVATHIAAGLVHNSSLAELSIGLNHSRKLNRSVVIISKEGCVDVIKAVCNNTSLKKLDISGSNLEMKGSEALAEMLSCNKSLTELNIGGCRISKAALREIARGLLQNSSLRTLMLWTTRCKASFETEIERLKSSQDFTPQSLKKLEIKAVWQ